MSPRSFLVVALALVFGGSAAVGVNSLIQNPQAPRGDVVPVVVAATDIPRGGTITAELVKTREFPKDLAPSGALSKVEDAIDRAVFIPLTKDDPVLNSKLAPKGAGRGMSALVPAGMRAFTITTNVASGVAGFILPGNKVDVLLTFNNGSSNDMTGGGSTTTLLQNVEILAVDQKVDAPAENKVDSNNLRSVTLLVTPNQASKLSLGQTKGTLHLTLRNPKDELAANVRPTTVHDIQFTSEPPGRPWDERAKDLIKAWGEAMAKRPPTPPPAEKPKMMIRTIRGSSEGQVTVTPVDRSG